MNANPIGDVFVWWTPDCGHLHLETNPVTISVVCPDGETRPDVAAGEVELP